jgi:hypothetical protein
MTANPTRTARARLTGLERLLAWKDRFEHAILQDKRTRKTIEHWQRAGLPQDFITRAINLYCLAPYVAQQRREDSERLRIKPLREDSEHLALKIKSLLSSPMAKESISGISKYREFDVALAPGQEMSLGQLLPAMPSILKKLSLVAKEWDLSIKSEYSDRKVAMSRALAWLYLAVQMKHNETKYRTCNDIAALLAIGFQVVEGNQQDAPDHESIRHRIDRFSENNSNEYKDIQTFLRQSGIPSDKELLRFVQKKMFALPSFDRYGRKS